MARTNVKPRTPPIYDSRIHGNDEFDDASPEVWGILNRIATASPDAKTFLLRKLRPTRVDSDRRVSITDGAADGPGPRFTFRWEGRLAEFDGAPLRYRLLAALWDQTNQRPHAERSIDAVMDEVYGTNHVNCDDALRDLCWQVRRALRAASIPLTLQTRAGQIWLTAI